MKKKSDPTENPEASRVSVVGIGASAGGLEAIGDLLKHIPAGLGMAFVVVQHLDPKHPSLLPELLGKHTRMPVMPVNNGMPVEANHVYVIPPDTGLRLDDGHLRLSTRQHTDGRHLPIDSFFRSLASDRKSHAIGVILSGTASDGTLGMEAIKAEGGITFAQDDASAKFVTMPRNAVASGCVDLVLNPEGIAKQLVALAKHRDLLPASSGEEPSGAGGQHNLDGVLQLLKSASGVDFGLYKPGTVRRRIARHMLLKQVDSIAKYHRLLKQKPAELDALYQDLLIRVTEFFREPESFEALKQTVFPGIAKARQPDAAIRIWVPGCATGEEVYSIAIALLEFLDPALDIPVQIFGTDLSEKSIHKARTGIYPAAAVKPCVSEDRIRRFFTEVDRGYQINGMVRDLCIFAKQNVTGDPPFSRLDLLSCRNVMIYMGPVLQNRAMEVFYYALKPSGYLMLGESEALGPHTGLFSPIDKKHKVFSKKNTGAHNSLYISPPRARMEETLLGASAGEPEPGIGGVRKEADRIILGRFSTPGVLIHEDGTIVQFRGQTGSYLEPASGEASLNILKMAREGLLPDLRTALRDVSKKGLPVVKQGLRIKSNGGSSHAIDLRVVPLETKAGPDRYFLVLFEPPSQRPARTEQAAPAAKGTGGGNKGQESTARLRHELESTRLYLQSIIEEREAANEELKSANEEIQSSNEEMQSTNEELETAKEELQSTNEELITVNDELQTRNSELTQLNNDLVNLLSSVSIPMVMLSQDLRIRRFTPMAEKVLNLIPSDVGRPMRDIKPNIDVPDLEELFADVVKRLQVKEREVRDVDGVWYLMRIRPYKTMDHKIDGVVLALLDIDQLKRTLEQSRQAREFAEATVETVQDSLVVLDSSLRVRSANRAFYQTFRAVREETEGSHFYDVDHAEWNFPELRKLLEEVAAKDVRIQDLEVDRDFNRVGRKALLLNARPFRGGETGDTMILLGIADITDRKQAVEARYRRLFETAPDGILVVDAENGRITDVNPYTVRWLGYSRNEVLGKRFWNTEAFVNSEAGEFAFREVQEKGTARYEGIALTAKDGRKVDVEVVGNIYNEGSRKVIQFNLRDITERRRGEEQIKASLKEKEVLLQEIHHRVKNNLQVITSLLNLQSRYVHDTEALRMFDETRNRVRSIADVHEMLYQSSAASKIDLVNYVRRLAGNLFDFYGASPETIQMKIEVTNVSLTLDKAVPCGLIINELLSNCLKHAFPDPTEPRPQGADRREISISLRLEGETYILEAKDNGVGFRNGVDLYHSDTLGLQLVNILADQLGGSVEFHPAAPTGVAVQFPASQRKA